MSTTPGNTQAGLSGIAKFLEAAHTEYQQNIKKIDKFGSLF